MSLFALDACGGPVLAAFRRARPGVDAMPWASFAPDLPPALRDRARLGWTDGAFGEFATAGQLAGLLEGLVRVRAPVDLIGAAGGFVADEMLHVELHARVLAALGGGAPYLVDDALLQAPIPEERPLFHVVARAIRTCVVGEALSVDVLAATRKVVDHPLLVEVFARIHADEVPHAQLGGWVLDWALPRLPDRDRVALQAVAAEALGELRALAAAPTSRVVDGVTREGFALDALHGLGWLDSATWAGIARAAADRIEARLTPRLAA